jgi:phage-related minor tail protein
MAGNRIKGITIELGADIQPLNKALKDVDSSLKNTQNQLKDVNKLLKLDPTNVELLKQKQDLLKQATADTKTRLDELNKALEQMQNAPNASETIEQQNALKREIIETENALESYNEQLSKSNVTLNVISGKSEEVAEKTKKLSAAAAGLAGAMIGNAIAMASTADDLNTLSQQTGLTVEEIQKMQYASDVVDVSVEQMTGSIQKMTKQMSSSPKAFEELGVSIYDANGNMRDATDVWYESLEALSKIDNETERDAKSMEIFGKSAMDMAGIIDDGGASLKALGDEAEDLGLIMGQDMVDDANELQDAIDKMKGRTTQAFAKMGASLASSLVPMFDKLLVVVTKVVTWFSNLDGKTQKLIIAILGLIAAISPVASLFSKITTLASGLSSAIAFMASPMGAVVIAIGAVIAAGVALYKNWDTIKQKASDLWSSITGTFDNIKNTISEKINAAKEAVSNAIERIKGLFKFEWSWPKIKLPHFRISGGVFPYGLFNKGTLPKIDIDWYAKAMKNGMVLNNPTIFGAMNGKLLGGGEAGSETIVGTNSLMNMIRQASQGTTLNGDIVINMNVPQGANGKQLVDQIEKELSLRLMRRSEVF